MRPPPVHFPGVHDGGGGHPPEPPQEASARGRSGNAVVGLVESRHATATSATTAPAPRVASNLRFLSLHMTFTSASSGFADANPRPPKRKRDATMRGSACCCPRRG